MDRRALFGTIGLSVMVLQPTAYADAPCTEGALSACVLDGVGTIRLVEDPAACLPLETHRCFAEARDIRVRVWNGSPLAVPDQTETVLNFDTERWDTADMHRTVPDPRCQVVSAPVVAPTSCLVAPVTGNYYIFANVGFSPSSTGFRSAGIALNGDLSSLLTSERIAAAPGGAITIVSLSTQYFLEEGQYVQVVVFQDTGGPLKIEAGSPSRGQDRHDFGMILLH